MATKKPQLEVSKVAKFTKLVTSLIGMVVVGVVIISVLFSWRITSGPISLSFLTPYFETALSSENGAYRTSLTDTILVWISSKREVDIQLIGTKVFSREGEPLADIPVLSVSLSAPALLVGRLAPKSLSINGMHISLIRDVNGDLRLDLSNGKNTNETIIANLLKEVFQVSDAGSSFGALRQVNILNASVTLDDRKTDNFWNAPSANIFLKREQNGLLGEADLNLNIGSRVAKLRIRGVIDSKNKDVSLKVRFSNIVASSVSVVFKNFDFLKHISIPIEGTADTKVSYNGLMEPINFEIKLNEGLFKITNPQELEFYLKHGRLIGSYDHAKSQVNIYNSELNLGPRGKISLENFDKNSVPFRSLKATANYLVKTKKLEIDKVLADLGGPILNLHGVFQEIAEQTSFEIGLNLEKMQLGAVNDYWPNNFEPLTRAWVDQNLSVGSVSVARAKLSGRWSGLKGTRIDSLIGDMVFKNMTVDYFAPMPKATGANGRVKFDKRMLEIEIDSAQRDDLKILDGRILFTGLDEVDQHANINLKIEGPLNSALKFLDSKPLNFTNSVGIKTDNIDGIVSTDLELSFVVERALTMDRVGFLAKAFLSQVAIPNVAFGKKIANANLILTADKKLINIEGEGRLNNVPVKLRWQEYLGADLAVRTKYDLSGELTVDHLIEDLNLGFPFLDKRYLQGELKFELGAVVNAAGKGTVKANIDFKDTKISIPGIGWYKSKSVETKLNFIANFSDSGIEKIKSLKVIGGGLTLTGTGLLEAPSRYSFKLDNLSIKDTVVFGKIIYDLNKGAAIVTKYDLSGHVDAKQLNEDFGLKFPLFDERFLSGKLKFDLTAVKNANGMGSLTARINLKETRISIPGIGWHKSKMVKAMLKLSANFSELGIEEVQSVEILGGGLSIAGTAKLIGVNYYEFKLDNFSYGETVVSGNVTYDGETWLLELMGPKIDLTKLIGEEDQNNRKYVRGPPVEISLKIDKIKLSAGHHLSNVNARLRNDGLVWSNINLKSKIILKNTEKNESPGTDLKNSLKINLVPQDGQRQLSVTAYDAGALLKTLGLYTDIVGGKLMLEATFEDMSVDSMIFGVAKIHDFRVIEAPILARLLGLASITGIPDELTGAGLYFQRLDAPFTLKKGIINLKDAKAGGLSLGITASGVIDKDSETLNIRGSVAPLDKINSLLGEVLGRVPLFGDLFSGGEKGGSLFAAEYSMMGPISDPKIQTNPLTALTPGIFRKIFKILPGINSEVRKPDWLDPDDPN